jgi:hypothetical protein
MGKKAFVLILVLLFSVLTGTWFANLAKGNPNTFFHWPGVYIVSPWNATYSTNIIQLEIYGPPLTSLSGFIPEKCWYRVDDEQKTYLDWDNVTVKDELNLTEGTHRISVGMVYSSFEESSVPCTDVQFKIDATAPIVKILSLENKTYDIADVPLNFTVNEPFTRVAYSLDGQENVTVYGNTTLNNLSPGSHNIVVYAWDTAGLGPFYRNIGASEIIYFTIELFPTTLVAIASVIILCVSAVFLLVRKHKHQLVSIEVSQETLSQEIFTKTALFRKVIVCFELRGSGLRINDIALPKNIIHILL